MVILVSLLAAAFLFPNPDSSSAVFSPSHNPDLAFLYLSGLLPDSPQISLPASTPIYPYSIIPGDARSSHELQSALSSDPVVAHHYADFRVQYASLVRLPADRKVYVSYRVGNRVYWTKEKVTLRAGEPVLSDGTHLARARCGNRISAVPGPTSPSEPTAAVLGTPVFPQRYPASTEMLPAAPIWLNTPMSPEVLSASSTPLPPPGIGPGPGGSGGGGFLPQPVIPVCCGVTSPGPSGPPVTPGGGGGLPQPKPPGPPIVGPPGPPIAAPEPLAFTLLCAGCIAIFLITKLRNR